MDEMLRWNVDGACWYPELLKSDCLPEVGKVQIFGSSGLRVGLSTSAFPDL